MEKTTKLLAGVLILSLVLLMSGCTSPAPQPPSQAQSAQPSPNGSTATTTSNASTFVIPSCDSQACFVAAANACQPSQWTSSDDIATFKYISTRACVFSKTLVTLNSAETAQMKTFLQGKNLTCVYTQGQFDSHLVTSMLAGTQNCSGQLKESLGELIVFAK